MSPIQQRWLSYIVDKHDVLPQATTVDEVLILGKALRIHGLLATIVEMSNRHAVGRKGNHRKLFRRHLQNQIHLYDQLHLMNLIWVSVSRGLLCTSMAMASMKQ